MVNNRLPAHNAATEVLFPFCHFGRPAAKEAANSKTACNSHPTVLLGQPSDILMLKKIKVRPHNSAAAVNTGCLFRYWHAAHSKAKAE